MTEMRTAVEVFCSYAHEDERWRKKLETHLSLLKWQRLISFWHDRLISAGTDWAQTIDSHLETASVILLLVSADFFASDYCYGIEMTRALERQKAGSARVIPILVRPVDWTKAPFAHLQALPGNAKPIVSWRNKETAFADVASGIRRAIEDLSLLPTSVARAALPAIWNIPYPHNPFFTGRDELLSQLHIQLRTGSELSQAPHALSGPGGIGKTQVATEYAYRYHQDYTAVLWARAESTESLISSYVALAALLNLPEREAREQEITVQAVKGWLQLHRGWLLILDNADNLALLPDFLPPVSAGHVILTTQAAATGRLARRLEIETLPPEKGALFLLRRAALLAPDADISHVAHQQELALRLSQELGGLPLALDQAGAYLEETGTNLADYWQIYQQHRAELLQRRGGQLAIDHPWSVATTWSLSFQRVEEQSPAATELLRVLAFLSPDAIPEEILTRGASSPGSALAPVAADAFRLNQAIEALRAYSLIQRNPTAKTLSIHRLVQAVLRDSLSSSEQKIWAKRVFDVIKSQFPLSEGYDDVGQSDRLISHAQTCMADAQIWTSTMLDDLDLASLQFKMARYFHDQARYTEAKSLYQQARQIFEQLLEPGHFVGQLPKELNQITSLGNLVSSLQQILEEKPGSESPEEITSLSGLCSLLQQIAVAVLLSNQANLYLEQGEYGQAEPLYQQVLRFFKEIVEPERLRVITSFNNLTHLIKQRLEPEYLDLVTPFSKLVAFFNNPPAYTAQPYLLAASLSNQANLCRKQDNYEQAELLYQQALEIFKQVLGVDHPDVARAMNNLAGLYRDQGSYEQAELLYQEALSIRETKLGPEHPGTAITLNDFAGLYREQGKYKQAEEFYQRALSIRETQFGPDHPEVAYSLNSLAVLYAQQGKYEQTEPLYQRALSIRETRLGPVHPEVATSLNNLANLYKEQGKLEEAERCYQRALRICEQTLGPEHTMAAYPLNNLADLYCTQGKYAEAEPLYRRALHIREQQLGPGHRQVAYPLNGLASLYREQGKYAEAEPLYQRALYIREQTAGHEHPETAETVHDLARLREAQGNGEEARSLYARALAILGQAPGAHHPKTTQTRLRLIALLHTIGRHEEAGQFEATQSRL